MANRLITTSLDAFQVSPEAANYIRKVCQNAPEINVRLIVTSINKTGPVFSIRKLTPDQVQILPASDELVVREGINFFYDFDSKEYVALTELSLVESTIGPALKFRMQALPICGGGCTFCHCGVKPSPNHENVLPGETPCSSCPSSGGGCQA